MNYLKSIINIKSFPFIFLITLLLLGMMGTFSLSLHAQTYANLWYNGDITSSTDIVIRDVTWAGSRFVAVGDNGTLYLSSNGSDWNKKTLMIGASDHLFGVGYNGADTVVAVGRDQLILCSEDRGNSWTKVHDRVDLAADLFKVAYGNGKFVAIDEAGGIWTSTDGKTGWAKYNTGWSTRCIAFGNGYFMTGCAGSGAIYRSETGEQGSWSNVGSLGEAVRGIAYGNSKWLAVGRNIATAGATGSGWTTRIKLVDDYNIIDQLYSCAVAPGTLIAAGEHGLMLNSSDGITWRNGNSGTKRFIFAMTYASGPDLVAAVGNGGPRDPNEIYLYSSHYSPKGGTPPPILTPGGGGSGSITVVSPNGGEQWLVGTKHAIQWTSSNYTGNVTIDYSYDGRKTWNRLTTSYPNTGSINWTIPATVSNSCFVKVYGITGSPADSSNSSFGIVRSGGSGTITVTYPNGGERWIVGQKYTITWSSTGSVGLVNIDYSYDGMETWYRLTSNYTNTGSLTWKRIADTPSTNCYVRVWDTSGSPTDNSNAPFTIARSGSVGTITITAPNGGERWDAGADRDITWTSKNVTGNVKLKYSTDNGGSWSSITESTANDGKFTWSIPEAPSTQCKVQATSVSDGSATDTSNAVFTILSGRPPKFDVNRHRFNFGYITGSTAPTSAQTMTIANTGGKTLNWAITTDQTWIKTDKASGVGDDIVQISVDPTGLTAGDYNGTLALSDPAAQNSPDLITVNLKVKTSANDQVPFGEMATPLDGAVVYGSIPVTGWVLDDVEVQDVKLYYNEGTYFGQAIFVEGARSDVAAAFSYYPYYYRGGWGYMLLTNSLADGVYTITAVATDTAGKTTTFGPKTITIDNAHSQNPFGAIDTPAQGGTISGSDYKNWGWALTPQPCMIPINGSTIKVYIDSVLKGSLNGYNGASDGIAALFPNLKNSGGPTGFFAFDTTAYTNGLHSISWIVTDDQGHSEGIGSRFFTIYNAAGATSLPTAVPTMPTSKDVSVTSVTSVSNSSRENISHIAQKDYNPNNFSYNAETSPAAQIEMQSPAYLEIKQLQGIELPLGGTNFTGYLLVGNDREQLPIGSNLDSKNGIFRWQPGPGFLGDYEMVFVGNDKNGSVIKKTVHVRVVPQFQINKNSTIDK